MDNLNATQVQLLSMHKARLHRCMFEASRDLNGLAWSAPDDEAMVKLDGWLYDMAIRGSAMPTERIQAVEAVEQAVTHRVTPRRMQRVDEDMGKLQALVPSEEDGK